MSELVTLIHSVDRGRKWNVEFDGELIVENSKDPECDTARALLARGITGKVRVIDADTGMPRLTFDIEKLSKLRIEEGPHGPRFVKIRQETVVDRPQTAETSPAGIPVLKDLNLVFFAAAGRGVMGETNARD